MKAAILTSPEITPAILVYTGATPAMSIGLVQGEPQSAIALQSALGRLFLVPSTNIVAVMVIVMGLMFGLALLSSRSNWRVGATLLLTSISLYGFAALYVIAAVASTRQ